MLSAISKPWRFFLIKKQYRGHDRNSQASPADELWNGAKLQSWAVHSLNAITMFFF